MQRVLAQAALAPETKPADCAKCVAAWDRLEDRKRVILGKPLPGSLRPKPALKPNRSMFRVPPPTPAPAHAPAKPEPPPPEA